MSGLLGRVVARTGRLSNGLAYAGGATALVAALFITGDVVARKFWGISSAVTDEIGGYALALCGMWSLAYTFRTGGHVRIDVLLTHLPRVARTVLDYVALIALAIFVGVMTFQMWHMVADSIQIGARATSAIRTPLAIPQGMMTVGLTALLFDVLLYLLRGVAQSLADGKLINPLGHDVPGTPEFGHGAKSA